MTGKRRYDDRQEAHLRKLRLHHEAIQETKKELRRKIEEEYETRLAVMAYDESRLMNEALRVLNNRGVGIAKTDVGRAVGTANWEILRDKFALTAEEFGEILDFGRGWWLLGKVTDGWRQVNFAFPGSPVMLARSTPEGVEWHSDAVTWQHDNPDFEKWGVENKYQWSEVEAAIKEAK